MHEFIAKDGNKYYIDLDDEEIHVQNSAGEHVGSITLMHVVSDDYKAPDYYYLQYLDLQKCKRLGIGTEALRLHNEYFCEPIIAASESGPKMDDGSHLIDDGIPFVREMRRKGYICIGPSESNEFEDQEY